MKDHRFSFYLILSFFFYACSNTVALSEDEKQLEIEYINNLLSRFAERAYYVNGEDIFLQTGYVLKPEKYKKQTMENFRVNFYPDYEKVYRDYLSEQFLKQIEDEFFDCHAVANSPDDYTKSVARCADVVFRCLYIGDMFKKGVPENEISIETTIHSKSKATSKYTILIFQGTPLELHCPATIFQLEKQNGKWMILSRQFE